MNVANTSIRILIALVSLAEGVLLRAAGGQAMPETGTIESVLVASGGRQGNYYFVPASQFK
jgi:hypothetical protein